MGKKKSWKYKLCAVIYHRRTLSMHLACFKRSFHEIYHLLNPDNGCRK